MVARVAVVDGSNVAYEQRNARGHPQLASVEAVTLAARQAGFDPIVIVDAPLHHEIDDPQRLEQLLESGHVLQAPARTDADYFILETAEKFNGVVVSNDTFADNIMAFPWVAERRVPYMLVRGQVELYLPEHATTVG